MESLTVTCGREGLRDNIQIFKEKPFKGLAWLMKHEKQRKKVDPTPRVPACVSSIYRYAHFDNS